MSLTFYLVPETSGNNGIVSMYYANNLMYFVSQLTTSTVNQINTINSNGEVNKITLGGTGPYTDIYSLAVSSDGSLIYCGNYSSTGSVTPTLFRFGSDGSFQTSVNIAGSPGLSSCYAMKISNLGDLFVCDRTGKFNFFTTPSSSLPPSNNYGFTVSYGTINDILPIPSSETIYLLISSTTGLYLYAYPPITIIQNQNIEGLGYDGTDYYCVVNNNNTRTIHTIDITNNVLSDAISTNLTATGGTLQYIAFDGDGYMYTNAIQNGVSGLYTTNISLLCFNKGTKILCMNQQLADEYISIENLNIGDFVKTYKHGYRKINKIIQGSFRNNPKKWNMCMYKMAKTESNGLIKDLIVTGGHSLLVDSLSDAEREKYKEMGIPHFANETIDKKHLVLSCVSDQFTPMQDRERYYYYHLLLENNDDEEERFGIWANGVLTETPNVKCSK